MSVKPRSKEDYVTLMIVPHGRAGQQSIQIRLPYLTRRQLIGIGSLVVGVFVCMLSYSLLATYKLAGIARLALEHHTQNLKLKEYEAETARLNTKLGLFKEKEQTLRRALGLAPAKNAAAALPSELVLKKWDKDLKNVSPLAKDQVQKLNRDFFKLEQAASIQLNSYSELSDQMSRDPQRGRAIPTLWPINGRVHSGYGYRTDPITRRYSFHKGIDIAASYGSPVRATGAGVVVRAGWDSGGYGYMVQIDHGYGINTIYGHNSAIKVRPGEWIKRGQVLALAGSTGMSTGTHVHYEVLRGGVSVSPATYLNLGQLTASTPI